jgi:hypothetical protein
MKNLPLQEELSLKRQSKHVKKKSERKKETAKEDENKQKNLIII